MQIVGLDSDQRRAITLGGSRQKSEKIPLPTRLNVLQQLIHVLECQFRSLRGLASPDQRQYEGCANRTQSVSKSQRRFKDFESAIGITSIHLAQSQTDRS